MSSSVDDGDSFPEVISGLGELVDPAEVANMQTSLERLFFMYKQLPQVSPVNLIGKSFVVEYDQSRDLLKGIGMYAGYLVAKDISARTDKMFPRLNLLRGSVYTSDDSIHDERVVENLNATFPGLACVNVEGVDYVSGRYQLVRDARLLWSRARTLQELGTKETRRRLCDTDIAGRVIAFAAVGTEVSATLFVDDDVHVTSPVRQVSVRLDGSYKKVLSFVNESSRRCTRT